MGTKLESLVEVLTRTGTSQEIIDQLILNYFDDQYADSFETVNDTYEVLTEQEKDRALYDIAEDLFFDYQSELERLASRSDNYTFLDALIRTIDEDRGTQAIVKHLSYEDEMNIDCFGETEEHCVYNR